MARKAAHAAVGLVIFVASPWFELWQFISLCVFFFGLLLGYRFLSTSSVYHLEKNYGDVLYPLGLLVLGLSLYGLPNAFLGGVLVLALADVAAYVAGRMKGHSNSKTWFGFLAFGLTAGLVLVNFLPWEQAILLTILTALIERFSPYGSDNLTIPMVYVAGYALSASFFIS